MVCKFTELRNKDVINISDGIRLGRVDDVEIDPERAVIVSVISLGRPRFFGIFGKDDDIIIPWENIEIIGVDAILVRMDYRESKKRRPSFLEEWLRQ